MKKRSIVTLCVCVVFITLSVTGILLYIFPHTLTTANLHTIFVLFFIIAVGFHFKNNLKVLLNYLNRQRKQHALVEAVVIGVSAASVVGVVYTNYPGSN